MNESCGVNSNELMLPSFISELCLKRDKIIETQHNALILLKSVAVQCSQIDASIPAHPDANHDSMDQMFYSTKIGLGEYLRSAPKLVTIKNITPDKMLEVTTQTVDKQLWSMLFNRLNIFSLMSSASKQQFHQSMLEMCQEFTQRNVESTLRDISERVETMLIDSLFQTITHADTSYASNSTHRFGKKMIFREALNFTNGCYFKPNTSGPFKDALKFLSHFIFAERATAKAGVVKRDYLFDLVSKNFEGYEVNDVSGLVVHFDGGKIQFFNNANAHISLENNLINYLNDILSKSRSLTCG